MLARFIRALQFTVRIETLESGKRKRNAPKATAALSNAFKTINELSDWANLYQSCIDEIVLNPSLPFDLCFRLVFHVPEVAPILAGGDLERSLKNVSH